MHQSTTVTTPDEISTCDDQTRKLQQRLERWQTLFWNRTTSNPRILILGAGYGGLTCALGLKGLKANVTLINRNDYHYLTTLLHEPAVGRRDFHEVTVDLPQLLKGTPIKFLRGETLGVDLEGQTVTVGKQGQEETLAYDFLVIALGSQPEFYDIPGLSEHAMTLSNWSEARRVHLKVEEALIGYKDHPEEPWRAHIVIGGAGLTGVELAGEMADWCRRVSREYGVPDGVLQITLLDGGPSVLASCKECQDRIIPLTTHLLEHKGIRIVTGAHVKAIEDHRLVLEDGRTLEAGLIIWTGGVRGHRLVEASGLAVNRQKRALVNEYLQAQGRPEVFVVGDSAAATMANGVVLPPTAQMAIQQGPMVALNFRRLLTCQPLASCEPRRLGIFLSVGEKDALGVVQNRYHFSGWAARTIKNAIGYRYLLSLGGWKLLWSKRRRAE